MTRAFVVLASVALAASTGCSDSHKTVTQRSGSADAAATCTNFSRVAAAQKAGTMGAAQVRVQVFTMAADLEVDAKRDARVKDLSAAFTRMSDAVKAGDAESTQRYAQEAATACAPFLKR